MGHSVNLALSLFTYLFSICLLPVVSDYAEPAWNVASLGRGRACLVLPGDDLRSLSFLASALSHYARNATPPCRSAIREVYFQIDPRPPAAFNFDEWQLWS